MSRKTFLIIYMPVFVIFVISLIFPYQWFNIPIEYSTIIRIVMGAVMSGVAVRLALLYLR